MLFSADSTAWMVCWHVPSQISTVAFDKWTIILAFVDGKDDIISIFLKIAGFSKDSEEMGSVAHSCSRRRFKFL